MPSPAVAEKKEKEDEEAMGSGKQVRSKGRGTKRSTRSSWRREKGSAVISFGNDGWESWKRSSPLIASSCETAACHLFAFSSTAFRLQNSRS